MGKAIGGRRRWELGEKVFGEGSREVCIGKGGMDGSVAEGGGRRSRKGMQQKGNRRNRRGER
jgi:hypothetical protein